MCAACHLSMGSPARFGSCPTDAKPFRLNAECHPLSTFIVQRQSRGHRYLPCVMSNMAAYLLTTHPLPISNSLRKILNTPSVPLQCLGDGLFVAKEKRYPNPIFSACCAIVCPGGGMFSPVTHLSPALRWFPGDRACKQQQRCAQGVPPNRRGDRRHCIAPATLWCIRPVGVLVVAPGNPVRPGVASCPRQLLCLRSRSKSAPCAKLDPEESRRSRPAAHCVLSLPQAGRQRFFPAVIAACNIVVEFVDEIY
jgi:hypothetical protein